MDAMKNWLAEEITSVPWRWFVCRFAVVHTHMTKKTLLTNQNGIMCLRISTGELSPTTPQKTMAAKITYAKLQHWTFKTWDHLWCSLTFFRFLKTMVIFLKLFNHPRLFFFVTSLANCGTTVSYTQACLSWKKTEVYTASLASSWERTIMGLENYFGVV